MGPVHGVAGLEGHYFFPAQLAHFVADFISGLEGAFEVLAK